MGYTVKPDGSIEVATLDEALALQQQILQAGGTKAPRSATTITPPVPPKPLPANVWSVYLSSLGDSQRHLLRIVKNHGTVTMPEVLQEMGQDAPSGGSSVAGFMSTIIRNAKRLLGLDAADQVVYSSRKGHKNTRVVTLHAGKLLQQNAVP